MPLTVKEMLEAANAVIERDSPTQAQDLLRQGGLLLDIREAPELERIGRHRFASPGACLSFGRTPSLSRMIPSFRQIVGSSSIARLARALSWRVSY